MAKVEEQNNGKEGNDLPTEGYNGVTLCNYHGFWYPQPAFPGIMDIKRRFEPRPTDILLASVPKSGTTWTIALTFATINRATYRPTDPDHPLLSKNPHDSVPHLEVTYAMGRASELDAVPSPRLLQTHLPYQFLSELAAGSPGPGCKIVYVCRDPKDTVVSSWHFGKQMTPCLEASTDVPAELFARNFEMCCRGVSSFGPMWDNWLGYWNESVKSPSKVLFLKYEDMKVDGAGNVRKLAEFLGCPFGEEEEEEGVAEEIVRLCSFDNLKGLQANKTGNFGPIANSSFFRKGKVGDWKNHFTSEMANKFDEIVEEKLRGSGLGFRCAKPAN